MTTKIEYNFTAQGLFPDIAHAEQNSKCVIVARVIKELAERADMTNVSQANLQDIAKKRLAFVMIEERLTLPDADHRAFLLYQNGVSHETAKQYYSLRLTAEDAARWEIKLVNV